MSAGLLLGGTAGCLTRTHVDDGDGVTSPDRKVVCTVSGKGALGHEYIEDTRKSFRISIGDSGTDPVRTVFHSQISIIGSDIEWNMHWVPDGSVTIDFHDSGKGVSRYDLPGAGAVSNYLGAVTVVNMPGKGWRLQSHLSSSAR